MVTKQFKLYNFRAVCSSLCGSLGKIRLVLAELDSFIAVVRVAWAFYMYDQAFCTRKVVHHTSFCMEVGFAG